MRPISSQPAWLYGTAKRHKLAIQNDVTTSITFQPIIDQSGSYTYNAAQVISDYMRPLCKNVYTITATQTFSWQPTYLLSEDDAEDVSYDLESLFTNIPVLQTIDYITEQIYAHNKIKLIYSKSIYNKLIQCTKNEVCH